MRTFFFNPLKIEINLNYI